MGINIYIQTTSGEDHPEWDSLRYGGDREIASALIGLDKDTWEPDGFPYSDDRYLQRPKDIAQFRALAADNPNPQRWLKAADILEGQPEYWLWLSY